MLDTSKYNNYTIYFLTISFINKSEFFKFWSLIIIYKSIYFNFPMVNVI